MTPTLPRGSSKPLGAGLNPESSAAGMTTVGPAPPPGAAPAPDAPGAGPKNPHQNRALHVTGIRCVAPARCPRRRMLLLLLLLLARRLRAGRARGRARAGAAHRGPQAARRWRSRRCVRLLRSPMVDEALLAEIFGAFGQLTTCKIVRDSAGVHGFCDFVDYTSARWARLRGHAPPPAPAPVSGFRRAARACARMRAGAASAGAL